VSDADWQRFEAATRGDDPDAILDIGHSLLKGRRLPKAQERLAKFGPPRCLPDGQLNYEIVWRSTDEIAYWQFVWVDLTVNGTTDVITAVGSIWSTN
jgi:hypothetical protein